MAIDPSTTSLRKYLAILFAWNTWGQRLRTSALVLLLSVVLGLLGFWAYGRSAIYFYHPKDMTTLSGKTRTHCVGRYLIDVPVEIGNLGASAEFLYGLDASFKTVEVIVDKEDFTPDQFMRKTSARINELSSKQNDDLKIPLLLSQEVWNTPHGKALMLRYLDNELYSFALVNSEVHILIGGRYAVIKGTSTEDDYRDVKSGRQSYKFINPKPMEDRLRVIAQNIKGYGDATRAPEGFCVAGVVMNDKAMGYDVETGGMGVYMPADEKLLPNSSFSVDFQGQYGNTETSLLQRVDRINLQVQLLAAQEGGTHHELRKGDNTINGVPVQEYADAMHLPNTVYFQFAAESMLRKEQQSLQRPFFSLKLELGGQMSDKPSPLNQAQALKVWDTLISTMRLSPANGGTQIDPKTGNLVPHMKTGQACPRSGFWEAYLPRTHAEARHLASIPQTYRLKHVRSGEPMPALYSTVLHREASDANNPLITWRWLGEG